MITSTIRSFSEILCLFFEFFFSLIVALAPNQLKHFIYYSLAWYDNELVQYQKERTETELEKTFEDRKTYLATQGGSNVSGEHLKQKMMKEPETDWQKSVKSKKSEDYYTKLQELENEQVVKESRLRESTQHQFAIPGQNVVQSSVTKGMAQKYLNQL